MEKTRKRAELLGRIKWLGLLFGLVMYYATADVFGDVISMILACVAATTFYVMCNNERKSTIATHVTKHLQEVLKNFGQQDSVFEIKTPNTGMVVRVYLIGAGERAVACSKLILDTIANSWYRSRVWITQIVDLEKREDIPEAQRALNEELFNSIKS